MFLVFLNTYRGFFFFVSCCASPKRDTGTPETSGKNSTKLLARSETTEPEARDGGRHDDHDGTPTKIWGHGDFLLFFAGKKYEKIAISLEMLKISEAVKQLRSSSCNGPTCLQNKPMSRMEFPIPVSIIKIYQVVC